jgi:hypothetical protein
LILNSIKKKKNLTQKFFFYRPIKKREKTKKLVMGKKDKKEKKNGKEISFRILQHVINDPEEGEIIRNEFIPINDGGEVNFFFFFQLKILEYY